MPKPACLLVISFLAVFALLPAQSSFAWIDTGHKIIAMIAWDELTPQTKAAVLQTLKAHPRYDKDLVGDAATTAPASNDIDRLVAPLPDSADRHVFATASTWPDIVRSQSNPMHAAYHHPFWHYIDIPVVIDNQPVPADKTADSPPPRDIVEALNKCVADLKNPAVSDSDKAIALCWVEHLVGDIHQPLHAAMLVSPQFPKGDQGGNAIMLLRDPPYPNSAMNLHLLWDSLPGQFKSEDVDNYEAQGLRNDPRFTREKFADALAVTDYLAWAKESNALAAHYAYLDGKLKGATSSRDRSGPREAIPGVPASYLAQAELVAMRQVALAGHRLADVLNGLYGAK